MRRPNRPWPTDRGNNWSALVFSTSWVILKSQSEKTLLSNDTFLLFSPAVLISWDEKLWLYRPSWQHPATPPPPFPGNWTPFLKNLIPPFQISVETDLHSCDRMLEGDVAKKKKKKERVVINFPEGGKKKKSNKVPFEASNGFSSFLCHDGALVQLCHFTQETRRCV